jgi:hypothetical protein
VLILKQRVAWKKAANNFSISHSKASLCEAFLLPSAPV